jgi:hypothetical protein
MSPVQNFLNFSKHFKSCPLLFSEQACARLRDTGRPAIGGRSRLRCSADVHCRISPPAAGVHVVPTTHAWASVTRESNLFYNSCSSPSCSTGWRGVEAIVSGPARDDHPGQPERLDRGGDLPFGGDVEVRGALVHEQQAVEHAC